MRLREQLVVDESGNRTACSLRRWISQPVLCVLVFLYLRLCVRVNVSRKGAKKKLKTQTV